jgi:SAM-dependent methyltransferase
MSVERKYAEMADSFTAREYGDPERYFGRRARIVADLGPPLAPGDLVVDVACADGSFAPALLALGFRYHGVDLNERMVEVARTRVGAAVDFEVGDMLRYVPHERAAATVCFRSLHFADDRPAFFRHLASFSERKIVFDADPRRYPLERIREDLRAAGLPGMDVRPFFVPQHRALPASAAAVLALLERRPLAARLVLARRFNVIVAGYRG